MPTCVYRLCAEGDGLVSCFILGQNERNGLKMQGKPLEESHKGQGQVTEAGVSYHPGPGEPVPPGVRAGRLSCQGVYCAPVEALQSLPAQ